MTAPQGFPARYIRTQEAAQFLGLSRRTLEKHRVYGTGPLFLKLGGRVVYKTEDLESWAERGKRISTSDPGTGLILAARAHDPVLTARANGISTPSSNRRLNRSK